MRTRTFSRAIAIVLGVIAAMVFDAKIANESISLHLIVMIGVVVFAWVIESILWMIFTGQSYDTASP